MDFYESKFKKLIAKKPDIKILKTPAYAADGYPDFVLTGPCFNLWIEVKGSANHKIFQLSMCSPVQKVFPILA